MHGCSGDKEGIIGHNNHQLRQDKAKLIAKMGSLEADCVELKVGCCQGSQKCEAMGGRNCARMWGLVQCQPVLWRLGLQSSLPNPASVPMKNPQLKPPEKPAAGRTQELCCGPGCMCWCMAVLQYWHIQPRQRMAIRMNHRCHRLLSLVPCSK